MTAPRLVHDARVHMGDRSNGVGHRAECVCGWVSLWRDQEWRAWEDARSHEYVLNDDDQVMADAAESIAAADDPWGPGW